jgi:hypothetical protein
LSLLVQPCSKLTEEFRQSVSTNIALKIFLNKHCKGYVHNSENFGGYDNESQNSGVLVSMARISLSQATGQSPYDERTER